MIHNNLLLFQLIKFHMVIVVMILILFVFVMKEHHKLILDKFVVEDYDGTIKHIKIKYYIY